MHQRIGDRFLMQADIYVDGSEVCSASFTVDGTGNKYVTDTWARGTYTFTAGQYISVKFDVTGTLQYDYPMGYIELQFDT